MSFTTGVGSTNTVVNLLGNLYQVGRRPDTLIKLLGGLTTNYRTTKSVSFPTGVYYNLGTPSQPAILEGANAPSASYIAPTGVENVIQIFQESVSLSYLAESDYTISSTVPIPQGDQNGPVQDVRSIADQLSFKLEKIARDANYTFLNGVFSQPANPTTSALGTRGILTSIVTNKFDHSGDTGTTAASYKVYVEQAVQAVAVTNGYNPDGTWTIFAAPSEYANIQAAYATSTTPPYDRSVAGLMLRQIYTKFGILNLVLEPDMPTQTFSIINTGVCGIVGLPYQNKGVLFAEPLSKTGSADNWQVYGQFGIDHGPEFSHSLTKVPAGVSL